MYQAVRVENHSGKLGRRREGKLGKGRRKRVGREKGSL